MPKRFSLQAMSMIMLLATQITLADTADFAFASTLSEGKQSIRQFELPYSILTKLERQDYGDLRIFNSQNQAVPFGITQLEPQTQQNNASHDLRFFRLTDKTTQSDGGLLVNFNDNTAHFSFNAARPKHEPSNYLIIENGHQNEALLAIKLAWRKPGDAGFSINVKLASSDDLQNWQPVSDATLYALTYLDSVLTQNTVSLPYANHAKYLRLSFQPSSDFSLNIEKITGDYRQDTRVERENRQTVQLKPGDTPNEWLFNTGGYIRITKIGFEIPSTGLLYQGRLYSKNDSPRQNLAKPNHSFKHEVKRALHRYPEQRVAEQGDWRYQGAVTQYRLLTAAGEIASPPTTVSTSKDRQWKLVLDQPATLLSEQVPGIKLAWHPVIVTFVAQGDPPYRLFFGKATVGPSNTGLSPDLIKHAETVNVLEIRAVERTTKPIKAAPLPLNWQKILLWVILCSGVFTVGLMAYQLYLQMSLNKD